MIAVVDYNMGNVGSILNMLRKVGASAKLTRDHDEIRRAQGLILPGVGAFDRGMGNLIELGLREVVLECVQVRQTPLLGICLGMQLLTDSSEEGAAVPGLGLIPGETKRFTFNDSASAHLRVPHMGWSHVRVSRPADAADLTGHLFRDTEARQRYYFVHSYRVCCRNAEDVIATADYGYEFSAAIGRGHVVGTQFHPEKSHRYGQKLMSNFAQFVADRRLAAAVA